MKLHDYQRRAVQHILKNKKCGLFYQMGLGKTAIVLTALDILFNQNRVKLVLVVSTKRIAEYVWAEECAKWAPNRYIFACKGTREKKLQTLQEVAKTGGICTISVDSLNLLEEVKEFRPDCVVFDESSLLKNPQAQRFKNAKPLADGANRVIIMTGTPLPNSYLDLWPQVRLLDYEVLEKTFWAYRKKYFVQYGFKWALKRGAKNIIDRKIAPICLSGKSSDYLELPPVNYFNENITLSLPLREKYAELKKSLSTEIAGEELTAPTVLSVSTKLVQFTGGAVYDESHNVVDIHAEKIDIVKELVEELNGDPLIVFYQFEHELNRLKKINGAKTLDECTPEKFNSGDVHVLLLHPKSAGHGLNLQKACANIVWYSLTFSAENYAQANARICRQGQKRPSFVRHLVCSGTIDEHMLEVLNGKISVNDAILTALR